MDISTKETGRSVEARLFQMAEQRVNCVAVWSLRATHRLAEPDHQAAVRRATGQRHLGRLVRHVNDWKWGQAVLALPAAPRRETRGYPAK